MISPETTEMVNDLFSKLFSVWGFDAATVTHYHLREGIALLFIGLLAFLTDFVCRRILRPIIQRFTRDTKAKWDDLLFNDHVLAAFCHLLPSLIVFYCMPLVFPKGEATFWGLLCFRGARIYIVAAMMRLLYVFLSGTKDATGTSRKFSGHFVSGFVQMAKLLVTGVGIIIIIGILLDRSPASLFAGLGVAATVLMLVFKDTLTGLVAGVQLSVNDMLRKGDWITVDKCGAHGIVEDVTLTTVKVRNFDNTIITIPPQTLVGDSFRNWKGMKKSSGRRVTRALFVDVQSVGFASEEMKRIWQEKGLLNDVEAAAEWVNLTLFRRFAERYIASLPYVVSSTHDTLLMIRQLEPKPYGLPVELYFFTKDKEWKTYENELAEVVEYLIASMSQFGLRLFQYTALAPE